MINSLDKILVEKLKLANESVKDDVASKSTELNVRDFIEVSNEYSNLYGQDKLTETLSNEGLSPYDIAQIISFQKQEHITEVTFKFFDKLDLSTSKYVSPLSSNDSWLSTSATKTELLSEKYAKLITYITQDLTAKDKAEFLAILDRYAAVKSQTEQGIEILERFKSFNEKNIDDMSLLVKEINGFAKRYTVNSKLEVTEVTDKSGFILYRDGDSVKFRAGGKSLTDCVFKKLDGSYGLICATSSSNTNTQQQLYKFRKALMNHFQVNVVPYLYCDSLLTFNSDKNKKTNENLNLLTEDSVNSFNLISAMQVFTRYSTDDPAFIKDSIKESKIQLFNDNAGLKIEGKDALAKVKLLEHCVLNVVNEINSNQDFWIDSTNQFNLQKKVILGICSSYNWLEEQGVLSNSELKDNLKKVLININFADTVNLTTEQDGLIAQTKKNVGVANKKLFF